jgi:hypothetical protein
MRGQRSTYFLLRAEDKGIIAYWYSLSINYLQVVCLLRDSEVSVRTGTRQSHPNSSRRIMSTPRKKMVSALCMCASSTPSARSKNEISLSSLNK